MCTSPRLIYSRLTALLYETEVTSVWRDLHCCSSALRAVLCPALWRPSPAGPGLPLPHPPGQLGEASEGQYWSARHSLLRAAFPAVVPVGWLYLPQFPKYQGCPLLFLWALQQAWRVLLALLPPGGVSSINPLCRHRQLLLPAQSCAHCPLSTPSDACPST